MDEPDPPDLTRKSRTRVSAILSAVAVLFGLGYTFRHKVIGHDFGESCTAANDCKSGLCGGGLFATCTQACQRDGECPSGSRCTTGKSTNFCILRGTAAFGADCRSSNDCASDVCLIERSDPLSFDPFKKGVCAQPCGEDGTCPKEASCKDVRAQKFCVPD